MGTRTAGGGGPMIIGITGPTGAGKTTALNVLRELGVEIVDADRVYYELLESHGGLKEALVGAFGKDILDGAGRVDRKRLSQAVYPDRLEELNGLTHPIIVEEVWARVEAAKARGHSAAIDAIALIECGLGARCDRIVAVLAPMEVRIRRIMARDNISRDYALRRVLAQKGEDFFRAHADHVLENGPEDTPEGFADRARALFEELLRPPAAGG